MANDLNKQLIIGRLGKDIELRYTQSGSPVGTFSVATSETWKDKDGRKQERTTWHRVELWGELAKALEPYLLKGKQVYVEGITHHDEWTDKDGNRRTTTKVVVNKGGSIQLLGRGRDAGGGDERPSGGNQAPSSDGFEVSDDDIPF